MPIVFGMVWKHISTDRLFVLLAMGKMRTTTLCEFLKKRRFDGLIFYEVGYFQASIFF
jgi:hypothetical protein